MIFFDSSHSLTVFKFIILIYFWILLIYKQYRIRKVKKSTIWIKKIRVVNKVKMETTGIIKVSNLNKRTALHKLTNKQAFKVKKKVQMI
jgi:hypothetical protein